MARVAVKFFARGDLPFQSSRKRLGRNACLAKNAIHRAHFDLFVIGYDAARCATLHDDVTARLPHDLKAKPLEGTHDVSPG
jgi:hypothetical protein